MNPNLEARRQLHEAPEGARFAWNENLIVTEDLNRRPVEGVCAIPIQPLETERGIFR